MDTQQSANQHTNLESSQLLELVNYRMPFGKYSGRLLIDLPEPYVVWFAQQGFPKGKLGRLMQIVYVIKSNGLEYLFEPLKQPEPINRGQTTEKEP